MQHCLDLIPDNIERVFVAFSGGLDSSVLLHLAAKRTNFEVIAWHINHGLLEVAPQMERFCREQAQKLGIELRIDRLDPGTIESNIEAEARARRYSLFETHTGRGDCILTAHQADDQAETFFMNALRGSGSAGLRGIARQRMLGDTLLLRPLLDFRRSELEAWAAEHEIAWFNDPSNEALRFDRNYLRREVIPLLQARWPHLQEALRTTCELQAETQQVLDELADEDLARLEGEPCCGIATLALAKLLQLSPGRRKNLLRRWVAREGLAPIPQARLGELMQQLGARSDAIPEISLPGYAIRIYDRRLFLVLDDDMPLTEACYDFAQSPEVRIDTLNIRLPRQAIFERLGIEDHEQSLSLRFRQEGRENDDRHRLKRLFQKHRVPPWRRDVVAQIYLDGRLEGLLI